MSKMIPTFEEVMEDYQIKKELKSLYTHLVIAGLRADQEMFDFNLQNIDDWECRLAARMADLVTNS